MVTNPPLRPWPIGFGLLAGAAIAVVDNLLFEGEVSPIVIVGLLLSTGATVGAIWGGPGRKAAVAAWIWIPGVHVFKRAFGFADTLHPNSWSSVLMLAVFALAVTGAGFGLGLLVRRIVGYGPGSGERGAASNPQN